MQYMGYGRFLGLYVLYKYLDKVGGHLTCRLPTGHPTYSLEFSIPTAWKISYLQTGDYTNYSLESILHNAWSLSYLHAWSPSYLPNGGHTTRLSYLKPGVYIIYSLESILPTTWAGDYPTFLQPGVHPTYSL